MLQDEAIKQNNMSLIMNRKNRGRAIPNGKILRKKKNLYKIQYNAMEYDTIKAYLGCRSIDVTGSRNKAKQSSFKYWVLHFDYSLLWFVSFN